MMPATAYRDSHLGKGVAYHESFARHPHRAMLWQMERAVLDKIVQRFFPRSKPTHLDVACGTGRILGHLRHVTAQSTGVDVSPSMLAVARVVAPGATLIHADVTREGVLGEERFDLITAFRFFPNAEPALRQDAMRILVGHLTDRGVLVFNNHKNAGSLVYRVVRHLGRGGLDGWPKEEVVHLVSGAGLRIVQEYPVGVLPFTDRHMVRPQWLARRAELIATHAPHAIDVAQNIIYVCREIVSETSGR